MNKGEIVLITLFGVLAAAIFCLAGTFHEERRITDSCRKFDAFYANGKMYNCTIKLP